MPFEFRLEAVLRVREGIEEREERALEKIQIEIAKTLQTIEQVDLRQLREAEERERGLATLSLAANLQLIHQAQQELREYKKALQRYLAKLRNDREVQLKKYEAARRDREMLSDMRQKQLQEYELEASRQEQKVLDDVFLNRRKQN